MSLSITGYKLAIFKHVEGLVLLTLQQRVVVHDVIAHKEAKHHQIRLQRNALSAYEVERGRCTCAWDPHREHFDLTASEYGELGSEYTPKPLLKRDLCCLYERVTNQEYPRHFRSPRFPLVVHKAL